MKWSKLTFWKSSWHGVVHCNNLVSWAHPSTGNVSILPAAPNPTVHNEPSCGLPRLSPTRGLHWSSRPLISATPSPPGSILPYRILISFWKIIVVRSCSLLGPWACPAHLLNGEALWGGGVAHGTFYSHLCLYRHLAQSWLPAENRESVRWKSGNGSNEHQAAGQGEMNESWLSFWKQHNVGTELAGGVRRSELLLSFATFELCHISQATWLLRASVSLMVK